ncbi:magnesium transporter [bacterium]|nr:magnesium transporter [bacterium]
MTDEIRNPESESRGDERILDPGNLDAERHALGLRMLELLAGGRGEEVRDLCLELSPGDLSEILRPLGVEDTASILRTLPPDPLAEVLGEIDNRSLSALFTLLDIDEIADILEEMPSDEAADVIGELDREQAAEVLAAMEETERGEVAELLRYEPETAGGLMAKEFISCRETETIGTAIAALRLFDEDELEDIHFVFALDDRGRLTGRLPLTRLLLCAPDAIVKDVMEPDPLYVEVDLDQEEVAGFFMTHDLISLPVLDHQMRMVGRITADDIMDVLEEEATEDISRLAGVSVEEFGEHSSLRVARSRLPWLLGALVGQLGAVMVMSHFEQSLQTLVALAFYTPMIMGTAGNIGIQASSVVVRGLATGELAYYHLSRHLLRELGTALMTGVAVGVAIFLLSLVISGNPALSAVLGLAMLMVVIFAATAGSGIPLLLHRLGIDPAVATGPFITTANDIFSMLIYLGLATWMLSLGYGVAS